MKGLWAVGAGLALTACFSRPLMKPPGDPEVGVSVRWWGHSCFSFRDSADRVLLIDPFDDTVGYSTPKIKPDAVLVTHDHFDHDAVPKTGLPAGGGAGAAPAGDAREQNQKQSHDRTTAPASLFPIVRSTGTHIAAGIEVEGIMADHDDEGGRRNGTTRIYVWEMGGLRWAHLGDIGQKKLRPDQQAALAGVDVLFVPVGGRTTVDAFGAAELVKEVQPKVVIPMHYGTPRTRFYEFDPLRPFQTLFENVTLLPLGGFQLRRLDLPTETTVYIPAPPGNENFKETP
jgi:L-ascorbate metabolism protein UlaG (beta-lactamase superfamily)